MTYTYQNLLDVYARSGVEKGSTVYITGDLWKVRDYEKPRGEEILKAHFDALQSLLGPQGTLCVHTASSNLRNTDTPFDLVTTPSFKVGALAEYVMRQEGAVRSFHPFASYTALGSRAHELMDNVSRHAYGPETPMARMIECDTRYVSIGLIPELALSPVHHIEHLMGVPYRYTKEFMHPVVRNGEVVVEPFYAQVWYRDMPFERDRNYRLMGILRQHMEMPEVSLGQGHIYSMSLRDFARHAQRAFADDIYIWCKEPPTVRPYRA